MLYLFNKKKSYIYYTLNEIVYICYYKWNMSKLWLYPQWLALLPTWGVFLNLTGSKTAALSRLAAINNVSWLC